MYFGLILFAFFGLATCNLPMLCENKIPKLKINTAYLSVFNDLTMRKNLVVFLQSEQCYKCNLIPTVSVYDQCTLRIDSRWPTRVEIRLLLDNGTYLPPSESCSEKTLTRLYSEGGNHSIYITSNSFSADITSNPFSAENQVSCSYAILNEPSDPNIPIYVAVVIGFFLIVAWSIGKYLYRKGYIHRLRQILCFWSTESMMSDLGTPTTINQIDDGSQAGGNQPPKKERLKSLDTFRGISLVIMIFVNYGGGKYWFFKHSKWNGLTVADLVFPWFVFIMGTAMAFSFQGQLRRNIPKWKIFLRILKRSATLFLLGLLINSFGVTDGVDFDNFRIPGVLQRFAGTYLITATVFLVFGPAPNSNNQIVSEESSVSQKNMYTRFAAVRDILNYWPEWIVNLGFVALHTSLTMAMPVPGCPSGYLGPGGLAEGGRYFNCTGGASGYIDRKFFGDSHIYHHPTSKEIYNSTVPYDPEGLLGTLTSCVLCFLGLQAGKIIFVYPDWVQRCRRFLLWALILTGIGTLLCEGSLNEGWIPINKNLWSLSFIFILSGMAFFLLMICYIFIDVYKVWSGAPFYFAGMNPIALYCGHEFFSGRAPVYFMVPDTHASLLALNIWGTAFWILVSVYFYYKSIFISV